MNEPAPPAHPTQRPKVAMLVAAYNAADILPRCLDSLIAEAPAQIVVVDDGSTDLTPSILADFHEVTVLHLEQNAGVGNARNRALEAVEEGIDYIAFIDSDIVLEPGWLDTLLNEVDWETYSAACGRVIAANDGSHWAATLDEANTRARFGPEGRELDPPWREVMYFNYLFRADLFGRVGEFDPRFRTNAEDSDFFFRCADKGARFYYQPHARGQHCYSNPTLWGWLRRCDRNGFYTVQFHVKNQTPLLRKKRWKLTALALSIPLLAATALALQSPQPILLAATLFLLLGALQSHQLGWRPFFGGWLNLIGWLAKALGEMRGVWVTK